MLGSGFSRTICISQRESSGSLSTFIKWLSERTMRLNNLHYSNGSPRARGKGGVLRWERFSGAHRHHGKFISPLILMPFLRLRRHSRPRVVWRGSRPPKPEAAEYASRHRKRLPHTLPFSREQYFLCFSILPWRYSEMCLLSGIISPHVAS